MSSKLSDIEINLQADNFSTATQYVETVLKQNDVDQRTIFETLLVFEAILADLTHQGFGPETKLHISGQKQLGNTDIKIGFPGKLCSQLEADSDSPEGLILEGFADKIDYSYYASYNTIRISIKRSYRTTVFFCLLGIVCAILASFILGQVTYVSQQQTILKDYVFPLEQFFAGVVLMVGAPVTFFSLLKNLTDTYVISERQSGMRSLQKRTLLTSLVAILLAGITALVIIVLLPTELHNSLTGYVLADISFTFAQIANSATPSSILAPFQDISPIPLLIVVALVTYALCSLGNHFEVAKTAIDACYALFSKMLHLVMAGLPLYCFAATLDVMLDGGFRNFLFNVGYAVLVVISLSILAASYAIRLRARGVKVIPFCKKLVPLLSENFKIGSAIGAAPYNIRYCNKHYNMDYSLLKRSMPIASQINLDGNCFIIFLVALVYMFLSGAPDLWINALAVALLVLMLSFGAPNQPGSILIALLIILTYLNSPALLPAAFLMEVFLGSIQNLTNVVGDIVLVQIEDIKEKAAEL